MDFDRPQKFQQGNQWLSVHNGLKGTPLEKGAMANGHYSDSLSRKLDRILNDHEYSDVEDAENISVQGNLEMQLSKLLDDTEDELSSNAWSAGSSSSSIEQLSARDFVGMGMFEGASNSNFELSDNPAQPLGVELAAALHSSSQHSSGSEETVGEEDGSVLCVHNNAVDLKNGWVGSDSDDKLSITKADKGKDERTRKPSSSMYPSSSNTSDSDSDEVCIRNPPKQYPALMSSGNGSILQSSEAENSHSADQESPDLPEIQQSPLSQETNENVSPVGGGHSCESAPISPDTKEPTEQGQVLLPILNGSHSSESPISSSPLEDETTINTLKVSKPPTPSQEACLSDKDGDVKSGTSEDSQENELELIKLQVCSVNINFNYLNC